MRRHADAPSVLFLIGVLINTLLISVTGNFWLTAPLTLLQAILLIGCQEAKHMCVHGTFIGNRYVNDAIGVACAALFGANFIVYRYFHLAHHRATCNEADPEGRLYAHSWRTRWLWLVAPIEVAWVSWYIGRIGWSTVPRNKRALRTAALIWMAAFATLVAVGLHYAPRAVIFAYLIPFALFSWFDFLLTQAEHYGVAIVPASSRREQGAITLDIALPPVLGWLTLHRSLHRVHHGDPAVRWFEAPYRLKADPTSAPITYATFMRLWLAGGPRLWRTAQGTCANVTAPIES
ncbi:fatty acid desaturase family protein [Trinickia acidisoli]|uniref:fatty acid desaturase family protein n=1 Tax=Trinickia acidisoli TaxID=2767482 RepID=UPI002852EEFE|nr:fatty acid desaturase [Trinickia acidisoli]